MAAFLTAAELTASYPDAGKVNADDMNRHLQEANAYAYASIGGDPPTVDENVKAAVVKAFEIFLRGNTAQVNPVNGNVTNVAPTSAGTRTATVADMLKVVDAMLLPYKRAFDAANAAQSERGIAFL